MLTLKLKVGAALVLAVGILGAGAGLAAYQARQTDSPGKKQEDGRQARARGAEEPQPEEKPPVRTDRHGDPLPPGAVVRLGTSRFRIPGEVGALAFSPDGKTLAVSSGTSLFLMDAASGQRIRRLVAVDMPRIGGNPVAFSPDGKRLAVRGIAKDDRRSRGKGVVRVWDLADEGKSKDYDAESAVWVGWSAAGELQAVCLEAGALRLDELTAGRSRRFECKDLPKPELSDYVACTCTPAGKALAVVDEQRVVHVWDTGTGRERFTCQPKGDLVASPAFSPDGQTLASLTREAAQLWDATTGKALHTVATDQKYLAHVAFTPDGKTLATAGAVDVRFWDVATGREQSRTQDRFSFAPSVAFSPDSKMLVTAERHSTAVHLWDVATGKRHPQPVGHRSWPHGTAFAPDGRRVATGGGLDGAIHIWDLATGESLAQVHRSPRWVRGVAFSPDGLSLFSTWTDENLWVCDAKTGEQRHVIKLEDPDRPDTRQSAISMYPSADGKTLVAFSYYRPKKDGAGGRYPATLITGWDTSTHKQLFRRRRPGQDFWVALSPDARVLAAPHPEDEDAQVFEKAPGKGPMRLEDVATGELLLTFPTLAGQTWPLAFSPDGRLLASNNSNWSRRGKEGDPAGATGRAMRLWETVTATEVLALPMGGQAQATFSPDGWLLALPPSSQEILVWDLVRGRELRRFKGFDAEVTDLTFSRDGGRLISGLSDSTFLVWDVGPREMAPAGKLGAEELAKAWDGLAGADAPRAFQARWALARAPTEVLPLLKERLRPIQAADAQQVRRWLADLDSERFEVRKQAQAALEELGDLAEPALRQTLAEKPTLEVRRRVEEILKQMRRPVTRPEALQALRAVAVLEDIATPEAKEVLQRLAGGVPEARLTQEAKAALARLDKHKK
jgi:WD40 repeat protein